MTDIKVLNNLLSVSYPVKGFIKFKDYDIKNYKLQDYLVDSDPYFLSNDNSLKIILRYPFFIRTIDGSTLIQSEEEFTKLNLNEFNILNLKVNEFEILEIFCDKNLAILALPSLYSGWAVFKDGKELAQHHGYNEGIE